MAKESHETNEKSKPTRILKTIEMTLEEVKSSHKHKGKDKVIGYNITYDDIRDRNVGLRSGDGVQWRLKSQRKNRKPLFDFSYPHGVAVTIQFQNSTSLEAGDEAVNRAYPFLREQEDANEQVEQTYLSRFLQPVSGSDRYLYRLGFKAEEDNKGRYPSAVAPVFSKVVSKCQSGNIFFANIKQDHSIESSKVKGEKQEYQPLKYEYYILVSIPNSQLAPNLQDDPRLTTTDWEGRSRDPRTVFWNLNDDPELYVDEC